MLNMWATRMARLRRVLRRPARETEELLRKAASLLFVAALFSFLTVGALFLSLPSASAAAPAVAASIVTVPAVAEPPIIDGNASDWTGAPLLTLDATTAQYVAGTIAGPADASGALRLAWDNEYLYIVAVISDSILTSDSFNIWDDDSIEIAIDGAFDRRCCGADDHQYTAAANGRIGDFGVILQPGASNVLFAARGVPGGYVIEMAVPLTNLTGAPVAAGTQMGFNLGLNDDDDGSRRDKRLVWMSTSTLDSANFGTIVFAGTPPARATRTATPVPAATATATATLPAGAATATRTATRTPTIAPSATAAATATAAPATATRTATLRPATATATSVVPTATATPAGQPTVSVEQRLSQLEANVNSLEVRIRAILDVMQQAGRFPQIARLLALTPTPSAVSVLADPLAYAQAVACGGLAYASYNGDFYAADQAYTAGSWGYVGGQTYQVTNAIAKTNDQALYQSERYGMSSYIFTVSPGSYSVTLKFAEIYQYAQPASRLFNVMIEDQQVLTNLDIVSQAGLFTALDLTFPVVVTDTELQISFAPVQGFAKISALSVKGAGGSPPTVPGLSDRMGTVATKLGGLETLTNAILDVFRQSLVITPTPLAVTGTATATPVPGTATATSTPTRTLQPGAPTSTATPVPTATATVAPTKTPTATATTNPVDVPHTSAKKGSAGEAGADSMSQAGISWGYTWGLSPNNFNTTYTHVPMIWGKDYDPVAVTQLAQTRRGSYWLIWNEPDYWQQANLTATQAAQSYRALRPLILGADPTAKLIVGGVLQLNTAWLSQFRSEYMRLYGEWPMVEGWAGHYYAGAADYNTTTWRTSIQAMRDWMVANGGLVQFWLTEFGCLNSEAIAAQIMSEQVPWLEAQPWVTRYAWYGAYASGAGCPNCSGSLFNADGSLTNLGRAYRVLP